MSAVADYFTHLWTGDDEWQDLARSELDAALGEGAITPGQHRELSAQLAQARDIGDAAAAEDVYNVAAQARASVGTRDSAPGTGPSNTAELAAAVPVPDVAAAIPWQAWAVLALGVVVFAYAKGA